MGGAQAARSRLTNARRLASTLVLLLVAARVAADGPVTAPIVGGVLTSDYPAVGALLLSNDPDAATTQCTGTLIGCQTFLTAAHCVCASDGVACQGFGTPPPAFGLVYFEHAGFFPIASISVHPDFEFPVADLAVVRLASPVSGIAPARIADAGAPPFGTSGTVVGYGVASVPADDSGLKRRGSVTTAPCAVGISDATSVCWDYSGAGANTCIGDSGGPLFVDLGAGPVLAGVTSGGFSASCLPTDHSYDADVYAYRSWIESAAAGDLGTGACGGLPVVGDAGVVATAFTGDLGDVRPLALVSVGVAPGTSELRVGLHGAESPGADFDLYVRHGAAPAADAFDCAATGRNQYGFCTITDPAPGSWYLRAERVTGASIFQMVATTFGGEPSACGNGVREPGEDCDGVDAGTCTTSCEPDCTCLQCSETDLDVMQIALAPGLFVRERLGEGTGTYTAVDPATAGVTLVFLDATHTVTFTIPPRDPGWVLVNPRRGKYRWKGPSGVGVRRVQFLLRPKRPTVWDILVKGRHVAGADTIDYRTLTVRVLLGALCAERDYRLPRTPRLPRS
jgi:hypothetical protein